jgi:hypothetical protein
LGLGGPSTESFAWANVRLAGRAESLRERIVRPPDARRDARCPSVEPPPDDVSGRRRVVLPFDSVTFEEMEEALRQRIAAFPPAARSELLHTLMLPDFQRAERIGEFWGHPESRSFGELLIDIEEDKAMRAVVVGMLRERELRRGWEDHGL